jgi:signal transduction histidine kinase
VVIRDTGKGIAEQDLSRIFDPFFSTKDVGQGTGLGLFITHDIIVRHDGSIQVKSKPGKGTTFIVRIPMEELSV